MRYRRMTGVLSFLLGLWAATGLASETGDPIKGQQLYRACAACHSLNAGQHMTGPSLSDIWGREAGTVDGFKRYSDALAQSGIVWDDVALDGWLADPRGYLPGNRMTFRGVPDADQRRDLIAFLRAVSEEGGQTPSAAQAQGMAEGGMAGMMGQAEMLDLKKLQAHNRIVALGHCGDTYSVTTETGEVHEFWEFNLRFKTDGSNMGPEPKQPVIVPASMMGDRAFIIFAAPGEISNFIGSSC